MIDVNIDCAGGDSKYSITPNSTRIDAGVNVAVDVEGSIARLSPSKFPDLHRTEQRGSMSIRIRQLSVCDLNVVKFNVFSRDRSVGEWNVLESSDLLPITDGPDRMMLNS